MTLCYKNATKDDIDQIFLLNKKLIEKYEIDLSLDFETINIWIKNKIKTNIEKYTCIYYDDFKVGYFYLDDKGEKFELDDLYVLNDYRGKGIGTEVLKFVDLNCKKKNKNVFLYVFAKNEGAIKLYIRNGYKIVKKIKESRYIMEKEEEGTVNKNKQIIK
ncbi:GNAT family N-acetyltransferase [Haloimpatiens sp. FM7315]|uniref:GNAT family N-acetyltransferase n=1 Tax=Haloimpatiens sp. FM7315 TaxID=3298609 RepID=UPI0035A2AC1C